MSNTTVVNKAIGLIILMISLIWLNFYSSSTTLLLQDQIHFQGIYSADDLKEKRIYSFAQYGHYMEKLKAIHVPLDSSITTQEIANMFANNSDDRNFLTRVNMAFRAVLERHSVTDRIIDYFRKTNVHACPKKSNSSVEIR
eukprot:TRINITY_DN2735_c0_g3_i1.p2 TRINITY_DN2735_c0_g3~~TRINITY_DN2735_c0_g3_i1.p2  ORF type:complete len:141 (-),score=24.16 TRINITY_DN2735_c0_g3_i1:513-935(-)